MANRFTIGWTIGVFLFLPLFLLAQSGRNPQFLQQVGVVDSLYSQVLGESRKIYVQLPASAAYDSDRSYPVAYILDGEVFLPTVSDVQEYYSGGFTPEMVLVGIDQAENRVRDLTPSAITTKYGMPFRAENGAADHFRRFIANELIPYVAQTYPVTNYRTLIGHSYGGLFVIYTLLNHPDLFANYLAIDPSLDWDDQGIVKEAEERLATRKYERKSLFMSLSGQLHPQDSEVTIDNVLQDTTDYTLFARSNVELANVVRQSTEHGLSFDWKFYPSDLHGTIPFPSLMDGLISLFAWYQMENTDKINSFDTPMKELLAIVKHREVKLRDHFGYPAPPYPEALLNMSGYMNMDMNQLEKAKMYFELAISYYPQSANAYDSMADYYEAQKDYEGALQYVSKAFALSGDVYYRERIVELKKKRD